MESKWRLNGYLYGMTNYNEDRRSPYVKGRPLYALILAGPYAGYLLLNADLGLYVRGYLTSGEDRLYYPLIYVDLPKHAPHFPYGYIVEPDVP